ncbi:hypothetical protein M0812_07789 [Anaeramoeba flamelloides]|uniref:Small ribosomal subunit protein uS5 n=1 Tax=Anaeramoeba flamelloides TaxID=1746091 RepID=A0AAV7ZY93_9EUKA|nr:hypothetical protein M0812_07789 [Anaeramoeba flamelloides]
MSQQGGQNRGRGRERGRGRQKEVWKPLTKLGTVNDEVVKIMSVQKQTKAGQRTRFKAIVVCGDKKGHVGLGIKVAKETAQAINGALRLAKLSMIPVRLGYWGNKLGEPHTIPTKITGKCGSVRVRLVPAPRGAGIVAAKVSSKILSYAGIQDVYTSSRGKSATLPNFIGACFNAVKKTYEFFTLNLWELKPAQLIPYERHSQFLKDKKEKDKLQQSEIDEKKL